MLTSSDFSKAFENMTNKLDDVKRKDDINDVIRFTGIFLKVAEQRKKEIIKADSKKKLYQTKAEKDAAKKEADKDNNSSSAAPVTSSETPAPEFSYNDGE